MFKGKTNVSITHSYLTPGRNTITNKPIFSPSVLCHNGAKKVRGYTANQICKLKNGIQFLHRKKTPVVIKYYANTHFVISSKEHVHPGYRLSRSSFPRSEIGCE